MSLTWSRTVALDNNICDNRSSKTAIGWSLAVARRLLVSHLPHAVARLSAIAALVSFADSHALQASDLVLEKVVVTA